MFEENAKRLLKSLLKDGTITDDTLRDYEFFEKDIEDLHSEREWFTLYENCDCYARKRWQDSIVAKVLSPTSSYGSGWKEHYDYRESKNHRKYGLYIKCTPDEFEAICKACEEASN